MSSTRRIYRRCWCGQWTAQDVAPDGSRSPRDGYLVDAPDEAQVEQSTAWRRQCQACNPTFYLSA